MKRFKLPVFILLCVVIIYAFEFSDRDPKKNSNDNNGNSGVTAVSSKQMDVNYIRTWYRNNGSFNRNPTTENAGFEWPKGSGHFARYASGLWMGAVVGDDTLIAIAEYDYEYLPGYVDGNGNPQGKDDPLFRIYKINKGDTASEDYQNWPVSQGAHMDENGKPFLMGEQTMFYSYTDGYPEAHGNNAGSTDPLKAQILQTNFSFAKSYSYLDDVIITELRIINRGSLPWINFYMALWTDDDLGVAGDDAVGSDSILNLGYTYNFTNNDGDYGLAPPAVGFLLLKGQTVPAPGDTAKFYSPPLSNNLVIKPGFKNLGMTAFHLFVDGNPSVGDPTNYRETYYYLQGIRRDRTPWFNPITNQNTNFVFTGDPSTGQGWNMSEGDDRRSLQCSGPSTVNPGDTQTIVYAQIIARSSSNHASINTLKLYSRYLQNLYDNNFDISVTAKPPAAEHYSSGNGNVYISWNDSAERVKYLNKFSDTYFKFQGYNIYQINSYSVNPSDDDTVLIKTFDIKDGIKDIKDSVYYEEQQGFLYGIVQKGSDNGISRFIELNKDTISNKNFINGTEYKFAVTAYYYDPSGGPFTLPKVLESPKKILKVIPQNISSGTQINYSLGDTILTDQRDLGVMPVIIDPVKLLNATYTSVFGTGSNNNLNWTLTRNYNGISTVLYQNTEDFSGTQDTAKSSDGLFFIHQIMRDSGIVRDPKDNFNLNVRKTSIQKGWTYEPEGKEWFTAPDTNAIKTAKVITNRQFNSRSLGMSFPTQGSFNNFRSRIHANGNVLSPGSGTFTLLTGGPLRKIRIVFGETSRAYRYAPPVNVLLTDTNLTNIPFAGIAEVPFSVYAADELDSTQGNPRRLNIGFADADANGIWDPDDSPLGKYQFTYIFASDYSETPEQQYMSRSGQNINPGLLSPAYGFPSLDIMYAWLPRVKSINGVLQTWSDGDALTVFPYRISRAEFVPGYPVKYSWTINGTTFNNNDLSKDGINNIKAFPNPYYGFSELEYNDAGEKFIYFSHLPSVCTIYIYSLDGSPVKKIERNSNDPKNSLEKWDLQNNDGKFVASGMYVVYIDCGSAGAKTLKLAVFQNKF
ncbi:MAG: hypothetical protein IPM38_14795 [Ignavibacteria bacterium]|nr:hypothetical protein [Ignavibacteria bacterium]